MAGFIAHDRWYETISYADGITLIHEPWIKPFFRCNMWHVRGRDYDLLFDSGLGAVPLRRHVSLLAERPVLCVASHAHFDHIGCHHEFEHCAIHGAEASILQNPDGEHTLAAFYANEEMFDACPQGWNTQQYKVTGVTPSRLLRPGDVIDLRNRAFEVLHTPGHSPGGIALWEKATGTLLSGDVVYDGPLLDDTYHSSVPDYVSTLEKLETMSVSIVHGGHFPSFGAVRFRQLCAEYIEGRRKAGCPVATAHPVR
ncbi:MAG: MBL fold metallo-hydrolase [Acetobacter papayae]